jgi:predicted phage terminase large subunit-like protein
VSSSAQFLNPSEAANQVLIEEAGTAIGLLQELKRHVPGLKGIKPDRDKETRMSIASAKFEAGQVYLPEQASWLPELEAELFAFPGSAYDDQIDSISQALNNGHTKLWTWIKWSHVDVSRLSPHSTHATPYYSMFGRFD